MSTCSKCDREFTLRADHKGYANVCHNCSEGDVDLLMAKVAWSGKTTVEIEITADRAAAKHFNDSQKRFGAGVTKSLVAPKESRAGSESRKDGSGAELGAIYRSKLGEKRSVK